MTRKELLVKNFKAVFPYLRSLPPKHRYIKMLYEKLTGRLLNKQMTESVKKAILQQVSDCIDEIDGMSNATFQSIGGNGSGLDRLHTIAFHKVSNEPLPPFPVGVAVLDAHFLYGDIALIHICIELDADGEKAKIVLHVLELAGNKWVDRGALED